VSATDGGWEDRWESARARGEGAGAAGAAPAGGWVEMYLMVVCGGSPLVRPAWFCWPAPVSAHGVGAPQPRCASPLRPLGVHGGGWWAVRRWCGRASAVQPHACGDERRLPSLLPLAQVRSLAELSWVFVLGTGAQLLATGMVLAKLIRCECGCEGSITRASAMGMPQAPLPRCGAVYPSPPHTPTSGFWRCAGPMALFGMLCV
jgi:hypothetical protein